MQSFTAECGIFKYYPQCCYFGKCIDLAHSIKNWKKFFLVAQKQISLKFSTFQGLTSGTELKKIKTF